MLARLNHAPEIFVFCYGVKNDFVALTLACKYSRVNCLCFSLWYACVCVSAPFSILHLSLPILSLFLSLFPYTPTFSATCSRSRSRQIRRVTVLFVNLGLKEQTLLAAAVYDEAMEEMHKVMVAVQESVYEYEGSINKFLMDDKGSTLVAVYGLPPVGHADDPTRGVLAALR